MANSLDFPELTAEEAAELIPHGALVAFSGFTPAGAAKAVPRALARRARRLHESGSPFQIRVLTGASTGKSLDDALAEAEAISWRAPYQASTPLRDLINKGKASFTDMHLSHVPQLAMSGVLGPIDVAVVEATEVTQDGRVYLTTSIGATPTFLRLAERVIIEINGYPSPRLSEMADIALVAPPPLREMIPIHDPLSKIGDPFALVDPKDIVGIVRTHEPDEEPGFAPVNHSCRRIADLVVRFLFNERSAGRLPPELLPLQSGVGNIANSVLHLLGEHPDVPPLRMYTEVFQDAAADLLMRGQLLAASATSLTLSEPALAQLYQNLDEFIPKIVLRPQELSNHPSIIRQLGVIAVNTVIEADIYGNANSTHVCGTKLINGIGGSGDFERNACLSIVVCPSIAKKGKISSIVPMCSHVDHNEHSVQVVVTEHGLADLRGLGPAERAEKIIDQCAHPAYRDYLHDYFRTSPMGHLRHDLARCFELHRSYLEHGAMLPDLDLSRFDDGD